MLPAPANAQGEFSITTLLGTGQALFSNVAPGTYAVDELVPPPAGWDFTSLTCSDQNDTTGASTVSGDVATIRLQAGENITCTYTNTKRGSITIVKNAVGGNATFNYDSDPVLPAPANAQGEFSITTLLGTGQALFSNVAPGTYAVDELMPPPAGWDFTSLTCSDQNDTTGASRCPVTSPPSDSRPARTSPAPTRTQARLDHIVNAVGGNATFNYDSDPVLPARPTPRATSSITTLLGTGQALFSNVAPGTYAVDELMPPPAGWDFTSLTCSDQNDTTGASTVSGDVATIQLPGRREHHLHLHEHQARLDHDRQERGRRQRHLQLRQ